MTRTNTVDLLLDERRRIVRDLDLANANLGAAEFLLRRVSRLLPETIGVDARAIVEHAVIRHEIDEFLAEDRPHPTYPLDLADFGPVGEEGEANPTGPNPPSGQAH